MFSFNMDCYRLIRMFSINVGFYNQTAVACHLVATFEQDSTHPTIKTPRLS